MPGSIVLLAEGESDRGALEVLARRLGHDPDAGDVLVVAMGGVTNVGRRLEEHGTAERVAVLCDAAEAQHVRDTVRRREDSRVGVFVCEPDLEGELIRAAGHDWILDFIFRQGDLPTFHLMQKQPAQRTRSLDEQLHRFFGIRSGRKQRYAADLAGELPLDAIPDPLAQTLTFVFADSAGGGPGLRG